MEGGGGGARSGALLCSARRASSHPSSSKNPHFSHRARHSPSEEEKAALGVAIGTTPERVGTWMVNARARKLLDK